MTEDERYRYASLVDFLVEPPAEDLKRWAGAFVTRTLQTGGSCIYRHGAKRLGDADFLTNAADALSTAMRVLPAPERAFFIRVLLLVPWEQLYRDTGLQIRAGKVIDVLSAAVGTREFTAAVGSVFESGVDAVKEFPLEGLLAGERCSGTEVVFELPETARRLTGVSARTIAFDRLEVAVSMFRPLGWQSNLRLLIPWWLDAAEDRKPPHAVYRLCTAAHLDRDDDVGKFCLLGLLDWMTGHPEDELAPEVLDLGLRGRSGAFRKAAAALAAALGRVDVLEKLKRGDPDKSVRKRAAKLLGDGPQPRPL